MENWWPGASITGLQQFRNNEAVRIAKPESLHIVMSMTPDNLEKLNGWFMEQIAALKAEGASEQDFEDSFCCRFSLAQDF